MASVAVVCQNDFFFADAELVRQRIEEKNDDEEIESVERPAEESSKNRMMGAGAGRLRVCPAFQLARHSAGLGISREIASPQTIATTASRNPVWYRPKAQLTDAEERRINKDTAKHPAHEVLAQIARDGLVFRQFSPSAAIR